MRNLDFTSWQSLLATLVGLALQDAAVRVHQISKSTETAAASVDGAGAEARRTSEAALRMEDVIRQINAEVRRVSVMATAA